MTLCAAWVRETEDSKELVFATDSTLTGGEKWNHGVKLFELPRQDCLLCFAGETYRAYPLILNLTAAIKHNERLSNPQLDIADVLYSVAELFTELVRSIFNKPKGDADYIGSEAKFLFGGWSWRENRFRIWRLQYSVDVEGFIYVEESQSSRSRVCAFLGDPEDATKNIAQIALQHYKDELTRLDKFDSQLDMEPLRVLIDVSLDPNIYEVDGALQIGKVYRSGNHEFFGIMWRSVKGEPYFLGKRYAKHNKPRVRYYDPDTCDLLEDQLPKSLVNMNDFSGSEDFDFLQESYSQEGNFLKTSISDLERDRLIGIFREHSYHIFRQIAEANTELDAPKPLAADD